MRNSQTTLCFWLALPELCKAATCPGSGGRQQRHKATEIICSESGPASSNKIHLGLVHPCSATALALSQQGHSLFATFSPKHIYVQTEALTPPRKVTFRGFAQELRKPRTRAGLPRWETALGCFWGEWNGKDLPNCCVLKFLHQPKSLLLKSFALCSPKQKTTWTAWSATSAQVQNWNIFLLTVAKI